MRTFVLSDIMHDVSRLEYEDCQVVLKECLLMYYIVEEARLGTSAVLVVAGTTYCVEWETSE